VKDQQDAAGHTGGLALAALIEAAYKALLLMLNWVIKAVPWAVLGIIAASVGANVLEVFRPLFPLLGLLLAGLGIHGLVYYPLMAWLGGVRPRLFFARGADAILTAASGNSSLAAVPVTLSALEKMGVSQESARLSACVGTNFNNDGIALYEAMVALFLAQACGLDLTLSQQCVVILASLMVGMGVAGVPEAGLVVLPLVLAAAGFPEPIVAAAIPLLMPIDWIVARARSAVNVMSDMLVAILLDRAGRTVVPEIIPPAPIAAETVGK